MQYPIIDSHCHIYPDKIADKAVEGISHFYDLPMAYDGRSVTLINESNKIGFPQVKNPSLKVHADTRTKETDVEISASQIQDIMNDAYKNLNSKKTFIGALDFLNSQATIALINKKAKKFEALA